MGRGTFATVATVEHPIAVFVAIMSEADQTTGNGPQGRTAASPRSTFYSTKAAADQAAHYAANRPVPLVKRCAAITVCGHCAPRKNTTDQKNGDKTPREITHRLTPGFYRLMPVQMQ
jgi:hypothetical protein